jgi:hypothetical protein
MVAVDAALRLRLRLAPGLRRLLFGQRVNRCCQQVCLHKLRPAEEVCLHELRLARVHLGLHRAGWTCQAAAGLRQRGSSSAVGCPAQCAVAFQVAVSNVAISNSDVTFGSRLSRLLIINRVPIGTLQVSHSDRHDGPVT